jgi:hypothetical protein
MSDTRVAITLNGKTLELPKSEINALALKRALETAGLEAKPEVVQQLLAQIEQELKKRKKTKSKKNQQFLKQSQTVVAHHFYAKKFFFQKRKILRLSFTNQKAENTKSKKKLKLKIKSWFLAECLSARNTTYQELC